MMSIDIPTWQRTIGRVAFLNCDPLYHDLPDEWRVLAAPPAWLTGHLLRKDCLIAPIPAADWALNREELVLVPELGIISDGAVGSVLLFGNREIEDMRDVAESVGKECVEMQEFFNQPSTKRYVKFYLESPVSDREKSPRFRPVCKWWEATFRGIKYRILLREEVNSVNSKGYKKRLPATHQ